MVAPETFRCKSNTDVDPDPICAPLVRNEQNKELWLKQDIKQAHSAKT